MPDLMLVAGSQAQVTGKALVELDADVRARSARARILAVDLVAIRAADREARRARHPERGTLSDAERVRVLAIVRGSVPVRFRVRLGPDALRQPAADEGLDVMTHAIPF